MWECGRHQVKRIRAALPFLLVLFLAAPAKSGGDLRNTNCWYDADGKLLHAKIITGPDGNYVKAECAPTFAGIFERPPVETYTRAQWEQMLVNKGRGPDFVDYAQENDREPSRGDGSSWWADTYNERQDRNMRDAQIDRVKAGNNLINSISNQINHPGGLNDFHPGGGNVNVRIR